MILGIDFDNTIVSYDEVFHRVAVERGLVPPGVEATKVAVRRHLVGRGREGDWTELQGAVYGSRMPDASPFPGVLDFVRGAVRRGLSLYIISHKTRFPFEGPRHDLHRAAHGWLEHHGFYDPNRVGLGRDRVYFELTKGEKLKRLAAVSCTHFVDDLPEILDAPDFPASVERVLFDPSGGVSTNSPCLRLGSWLDAPLALAVTGGGP